MYSCGLLELFLNVLQHDFFQFESVRRLKYLFARETFYLHSANQKSTGCIWQNQHLKIDL